MKKLILSLFAIVMVASFSNRVVAQATASATATATIVTPISIAKATGGDMKFGNVAVTSTAGTVVLTTAGSRSTTGGVTLPTVTGDVAAAAFEVTGSGTYTYTITLPTTDHTITRASGSESMIVNSFTSDPSGTGTLSSGSQSITVGATLNVGSSQVAGVYTNASGFDVTVNYN